MGVAHHITQRKFIRKRSVERPVDPKDIDVVILRDIYPQNNMKI